MFGGRLIKGVATLGCAAVLVAPTAGAASKPITQGYGNPVARTVGVLNAQKTIARPNAAVARRSTLPFTGLDLALLSLGGGGLLALGAGLRRVGRVGR